MQRVAAASQRVQASLAKTGCHVFSITIGGYYLYLLLPEGVDYIGLARDGVNEGIFTRLEACFASTKCTRLQKQSGLNVSRVDDPRFYDFLLRKLS